MSIIEKNSTMLENTFSDYLMKKTSESAMTKKLSTILSNTQFGEEPKHFEVEVINEDRKETFFGMRIFPVIDNLDGIVSNVVNDKIPFKELCKKWRSIENWYIEIDAQAFDRYAINFIPKELVSLLYHEIGHIIYSEKPIEGFYRAYQEAYMRLKIADKASLKVLYLLYTIPLATACMPRSWFIRKRGNDEEVFADSLATTLGYGEYLNSALEKVVKAYGNTIQSDNGADVIESSIKWCNLNVIDLIKRQRKLKDDLFYQTLKSDSNYFKALSVKILNTLGLELRENYSGAVVESSLNVIQQENFCLKYNSVFNPKVMGLYETMIKAAQESANMQLALESKTKLNFPSQYDIDAIFVEVDRISNHHDRIYVLDLIYNQISELEKFKELCDIDNSIKRKYGNKIDPMLKQLDELRKAVLDKRIFNTNYKVFVKVPDGYVG